MEGPLDLPMVAREENGFNDLGGVDSANERMDRDEIDSGARKSEESGMFPIELLPCAKELFRRGALTPSVLKNWGIPWANMGQVYLSVSQGDTRSGISESGVPVTGVPTMSTMPPEQGDLTMTTLQRTVTMPIENNIPYDRLSTSSADNMNPRQGTVVAPERSSSLRGDSTYNRDRKSVV